MMNIEIKKVNGCPTMTATKGVVTFVYEGMDFILCKAIIKLESSTVDGNDFIEITDNGLVEELERQIITEEESNLLCKAANDYIEM